MSTTYTTRKIVEELQAILEANSDIDYVSSGALEALASEDNERAVYISVENIAVEPTRLNVGVSGYDRHMIINLYCNYDGTDDSLGVYDFTDSIEKCILEDNALWESVVDRELIAINYDNQENAPKRAITMLFDIYFRVVCD